MNDFKICLHNHIIFNGFTVHPGMIFGIDTAGNTIVTNGKRSRGGYWVYIGNEFAEFKIFHISVDTHSSIFTKVEKAIRLRERKNIKGVSYRNAMQLEGEHWESDELKRHYKSACTPIGHSPKSHITADPGATAKYNSMKERNTLTQRLNICKYSNAGNCTVVI